MAKPAKIRRSNHHDQAVIAVRVLDDAHMTWVAAELDSEHALRAWFDASPPQRAGACTSHTAYRSTARRRQRAT